VRAVERRPGAWIVLFDRSGLQIVNSSKPFGSSLPNPFRETRPLAADPRYPHLPTGGAAPVRKVFETGRSVASDLFVALDSKEPTIGVGVPVLRNGQVVHALEMSIHPEVFARMLLDQHLPADAVALILDSQTSIIARIPDHPRWMGRPPTPDQRAQVATAAEGFGLGGSLDGHPVYLAFIRSKATRWTTVVGLSQAAVDAPRRRTLALLAGGAASVLLLGLGAALVLGQRIATPLSMLARWAPIITRGERVALGAPVVREVKALHDALLTAGEAVREGAAERERRLIAEARRVEAEAVAAAVAASESRLRVTLASIGDAVIATDHEGRVTLMNPVAEALTGWIHVEALGKPVEDVFVIVNETSRQPAENPARRVLREGRITGLANRTVLISKAGGELPIDDSAAPIRGEDGRLMGAVMVFRDITERRRAEARFHRIVEAAPTAIVVVNPEGRIVLLNS
jgi:PAS domain S-box-containing protein